MSNEMLQKTIDLVSSLEVKNETQQIAKYELIEYTERLHKENQELKKQLEKKYEKAGTLTGELLYEENTKLIKQQKEFIEYLENQLNICDGFIDTIKSDLEEISYAGRASGKTYIATQIMKNETAKKCYEESLEKYKELIGVKDE